MRPGTQSVSEQLSQKKVNTAKYCKAESILTEYLQQEWALLLPATKGACKNSLIMCSRMCQNR